MAIYLKDYNAVFLHIPKTGGIHVRYILKDVLHLNTVDTGYRHSHRNFLGRRAITSSVLRFVPFKVKLALHNLLLHIGTDEYRNAFKFAFVRHPLDWYHSYWTYRIKKLLERNLKSWSIPRSSTLWAPLADFQKNCGSFVFEKFIDNVIEKHPGFLTKFYELFIGTEEYPINFIGRAENLNEDLIKALKKIGVSFDAEKIRHVAKIHATDNKYKRLAVYKEEQKQKILELEHGIIKRFYS